MNRKYSKILVCMLGQILAFGCSHPVVYTVPSIISDTSNVEIVVNSEEGNKGLLDYGGEVFVHLGLITDSSEHSNDWRYKRFEWGGTDSDARATRISDNRWSYRIPNIRKYFGVPTSEKILSLAILFRSGNCIDTNCKVLRNEDKSDIHIDINPAQ